MLNWALEAGGEPGIGSRSGCTRHIYPGDHPSFNCLVCAVLRLREPTLLIKKKFFLKCTAHYPEKEICLKFLFDYRMFLMSVLLLNIPNYGLPVMTAVLSFTVSHHLMLTCGFFPRLDVSQNPQETFQWSQEHYWLKHIFQWIRIFSWLEIWCSLHSINHKSHQSKIQIFCWKSFVVNTLKITFRSKLQLSNRLLQLINCISGL